MPQDPHQREMLNSIGRQIARLRGQRGWTQEQLAEAAGLDPQAIQRAETGKSALSYGRLKRVADALAVPPALMLRREADTDAVTNEIVERVRAMSSADREASLKLITVLSERSVD